MKSLPTLDGAETYVNRFGDVIDIGGKLFSLGVAMELKRELEAMLRWPLRFTLSIRDFALEAHCNRKQHWRTAKEASDHEKQRLTIAWLEAAKPMPRLPCEVTFVRIAPRALDEGDNLASAFKFMRDELCRCWGLTIKRGRQVQARDGAESGITWRYEQEKPTRSGYHEIRIEVRYE